MAGGLPRESPLQRSRTGAETVLARYCGSDKSGTRRSCSPPSQGSRLPSLRCKSRVRKSRNHCTCKRLTFTFNCVRTKISNPAPGWVWEDSNDVRRPLVEVRGHVEQLRDPPVDHCAGGTVRPDAAVVVCVRALGAARAGDLRVQPSVACVPAPCATRPCIR